MQCVVSVPVWCCKCVQEVSGVVWHGRQLCLCTMALRMPPQCTSVFACCCAIPGECSTAVAGEMQGRVAECHLQILPGNELQCAVECVC